MVIGFALSIVDDPTGLVERLKMAGYRLTRAAVVDPTLSFITKPRQWQLLKV
ncbi:MAG: hypothetical protein WDN30_00295 [Pararobbsia sp.]